MRICIAPRWGANAEDDWYPWAVRALRPHQAAVVGLGPNPRAPCIDASVAALTARLGIGGRALAETVLVGHSVGCLALLHYLASLPPAARLGGLLLVAGWWTLEHPAPELQPWCRAAVDTDRVRRATNRTIVLLGEDDPLIADPMAEAGRWRERLGADVRLVTGAGHFKRTSEPAALEAARELLAG